MVPGTGQATKKKRNRNKWVRAERPVGLCRTLFFDPERSPYFCAGIDEKQVIRF